MTDETMPFLLNTLAGPLHLTNQELGAYNVERVRDYWEANPYHLNKQIAYALGLNLRTVARCLRIIRGQQ